MCLEHYAWYKEKDQKGHSQREREKKNEIEEDTDERSCGHDSIGSSW